MQRRSPDEVPVPEVSPSPETIAVLVDNHRRFLDFLERRVGDRDEAEEILQAAFVRGIERAGEIRDRQRAQLRRADL